MIPLPTDPPPAALRADEQLLCFAYALLFTGLVAPTSLLAQMLHLPPPQCLSALNALLAPSVSGGPR